MDWERYLANLWIERLIWVGRLILSILFGLRDTNYVIQRMQRNDAELGQVLGNVYGSEAGQKFEELLGKYIFFLSEVVSTIKSGNNTDPIMQQWFHVAEELAEFLSQLNPYWEKSVVEALMKYQMDMDFRFASDIKNEQFEQSSADFDPALNNALQAAQLMINGITMDLTQNATKASP